MTSIDRLNRMILGGKCPRELDFNEDNNRHITIDYEKVKYNAFYKTYDYSASKFSAGCESLPNFDKVVTACIPKFTPLEEYLQKELEAQAKEELEELEKEELNKYENSLKDMVKQYEEQ